MRQPKYPLLTLLALTTYGSLSAQTVSQEQALQRGVAFLNQNQTDTQRARQRGITATDYEVVQSTSIVRQDSVQLVSEAFYVIQPHDAEGFVIVAADDRMNTVLAYSETGSFDPAHMPDALRTWLEGYAREYTSLASASNTLQAADSQATAAGTTSTDYTVVNDQLCTWLPIQEGGVSPLLGARDWGQNAPYNSMTPLDSSTGTHCVTGCVATALAQVMAYHKWPAQGQGSLTYTTPNVEGEISVDFSQSHYDWEHMRDIYAAGQYTQEEGDAVALLMRDCGVAMHMIYRAGNSSAITPYIPNYIPPHFDYTTDMAQLYAHNCDEIYTWQRILMRELNNKRPVIYSGSSNNGGHCFVLDGYQMRDDSPLPYYHVNWGWPAVQDFFGLDYRGYYLLSGLQASARIGNNTHSADNYNKLHSAIINFRPNRNMDDEPLIISTRDANSEWTCKDLQIKRLPQEGGEELGEESEEAEWYYGYGIRLQKLVGRDYHGTISLRAVNSQGVSRELMQSEITITKQHDTLADWYLSLPDDMAPDVYTMEWYLRENGSTRDSMLQAVSGNHLVIYDQVPQLTARILSTSAPQIQGSGYSITLEVTNHSSIPFFGYLKAKLSQSETQLEDETTSDYISIPAGQTRQLTVSGTSCYLAATETEICFCNCYDMSVIPSAFGGEALTYTAPFEPVLPLLQAASKEVTQGESETALRIVFNQIKNVGDVTFSGDFRLMMKDRYQNEICTFSTECSVPQKIEYELYPDSDYPRTDVSFDVSLPDSIPNGLYKLVLETRQTNGNKWRNVGGTSYFDIHVTDDLVGFFISASIDGEYNYFFTIPRPYYCGTPSFHYITFAVQGEGEIRHQDKVIDSPVFVRRGNSVKIDFKAKDPTHAIEVINGDQDLTTQLTSGKLKLENIRQEIPLQVTFGDLWGDLNKDKRVSVGDLATLVGTATSSDDYWTVDLNHNGRIDAQDYQIMAQKIITETTFCKAIETVSTDETLYHQGYPYVDLGLPAPYDKLRWATCNVGASRPYQVGKYFAWGETEDKLDYSKQTYAFDNENDQHLCTKYQGIIDSSDPILYDYEQELDGLTQLAPEDDAAHAVQGGNWQIPSSEEWQALIDHCTMTIYPQGHPHYKGVAGIEFVGPNGNKLFLPEAGFRNDKSNSWTTSDYYYWTRDLFTMSGQEYEGDGTFAPFWDTYGAYNFYLFYDYSSESNTPMIDFTYRAWGLPIRPVFVIDNE